jgi:hypothetical protein
LASEPRQKFLFDNFEKRSDSDFAVEKIELKNQERKTWKINFDDYFVEKVQQVSFI